MFIVNTEWYRVFMLAAQTGNLTKAARLLHMTQPSVSYTIKQLEDTLGILLFDRLSKGVRLTREGEALFHHVLSAFHQLEQGEELLRVMKHYEDGHVRIGASGAIIKDIVLPVLDEFRKSYPQIRIRFLQETTSRIMGHLKQGTLDIGFVHLPLADHDIEVMPMRALRNCFVVGKNHRELSAEPVPTQQLLQIPLLMLSEGSHTRMLVDQWFRAQGYETRADIELGSIDMLIEFAVRGYGAAFVPHSFVQQKIGEGDLFELCTHVPIPDQFLGMAIRNNAALSIASRAFYESFTRYDAGSE